MRHSWPWLENVKMCIWKSQILAHTKWNGFKMILHVGQLLSTAYSLIQTQQNRCSMVCSWERVRMALWVAARLMSSLIAAVTSGRLCDANISSSIFSVTSPMPAASSSFQLLQREKKNRICTGCVLVVVVGWKPNLLSGRLEKEGNNNNN